jgi:hypothetical protein
MNNVVSRFVGGSPMTVLLRLIVVSFVVGFLLETLGFDPSASSTRSCGRQDTSLSSISRTSASSAASS